MIEDNENNAHGWAITPRELAMRYISIAIGTFATILLGKAWLHPINPDFIFADHAHIDNLFTWAASAATIGLIFALIANFKPGEKEKGPKWVRITAIVLNFLVLALAVVHFI